NRPAPRIVSAIEDLARQLHPEAFPALPADEKELKNPSPAQPQLSSGIVDSPSVDHAFLETCTCAP
ncbi:MAG: hypothetical protein WA639_14450, partial [Candidatus Acidiferrum sp.]